MLRIHTVHRRSPVAKAMPEREEAENAKAVLVVVIVWAVLTRSPITL